MKIFKLLMILSFIGSCAIFSFAQKMTAEEIVAKHLDSIGTAENRAKVKNEAILGTADFSLALDKNSVYAGGFAFAAEGMKRLFGITFDKPANSDYPLERMIYNEKDLKIAPARLGQRSAFGSYLFRNEKIIKDGLLGGTLFNNWAIVNLEILKAKVEFDGKKKVNDVDAYVLNYISKKGSGVIVKLYFDAATFRHIRTEYRSEISARMGTTPEASSRQSEIREVLTEDFSDFKPEEGLTLPHSYQIYYSVLGATSKEFVYNFKVNKFYFNQDLGADPFELNQKR